MLSLYALSESMHCLESVDKNDFQRRARLLQAIWRTEHGYPIGELRGKPRGALLEMPWAKQTLANFLNDDIRRVVRETLDGGGRQAGSLIQPARMYSNLLSSQPMAFNLFVPLQLDLNLASAVFSKMLPHRCRRVTRIEFEFSPGRGDPRYTCDGSAFDVCVWFNTPEGKPAFVGIEVKYHENLNDEADEHRARYDEIAHEMGCFHIGVVDRLRCKPLQQIWRDHLLAGSYRLMDGYTDGLFVFLSPSGNTTCNDALAGYQVCLSDLDTFQRWTLEHFVEAVRACTGSPWINIFSDRYLNFERVDTFLQWGARCNTPDFAPPHVHVHLANKQNTSQTMWVEQ